MTAVPRETDDGKGGRDLLTARAPLAGSLALSELRMTPRGCWPRGRRTDAALKAGGATFKRRKRREIIRLRGRTFREAERARGTGHSGQKDARIRASLAAEDQDAEGA